MKGQIKPLKRLAIIAETFGRGLDAPELKASGALEIRQTTTAFNQMRTRIKRFLKQRTDMLAGVSHDLRTPLTRMKLQLSLMKDDKAKKELENDIIEMTAMLDSYVSFVRGETPEPIEAPEPVKEEVVEEKINPEEIVREKEIVEAPIEKEIEREKERDNHIIV